VVEFVSTEHTARNLMIRAVSGLPVGDSAFIREYSDMKRFWNLTPYVESALDKDFEAVLNGRFGPNKAATGRT
jgi:hypothetical protein